MPPASPDPTLSNLPMAPAVPAIGRAFGLAAGMGMGRARLRISWSACSLIFVACLLLSLLGCGPGTASDTGSRLCLDLSGPGWTVWLDEQADWQQQAPRLPGLQLAELSPHPPSCGFARLAGLGRPIAVPGTLEGLLWPEHGDLRGVSWWSRELELPASAAGRRARLRFQSVRLSAEVYLDGHLLGYDDVGNTSFVVELGRFARPGQVQRLDVRLIDPAGNFDWIDHTAQRWGEVPIPASHGFGGITGEVLLEVVDCAHVADVFVRNTADPGTVQVQLELAGAQQQTGPLGITILAADDRRVLLRKDLPAPSDGWPERVVRTLHVPDAPLWQLDDPQLALCRVRFGQDVTEVRFGFRWFAPEGLGQDARLTLNGKRIVLRSAISWGFWPVTGSVPTRELARREVSMARELGLNMLNHHRSMAHPYTLDASDELGLLAHLEPGGYWAQGGNALTRGLARERWLRMVRAARNHPSVVIENMINEADEPPGPSALADLAAARALDPSRLMTYTSAWADEDDPALSLHAWPLSSGAFDPRDPAQAPVTEGWHDQHAAPGPGCWRDALYGGPGQFFLASERRGEIVLRGEEAAIPGPPRLALMPGEFDRAGRDGWDGAAYRRWHDGWLADASAMGLIEAFGSLDALTLSAGAVAADYHARAIALARAFDVIDAYVINGWESERLENHSGIVDVWRRSKADPSILARANGAALVVLAPRAHVLHGARRVGVLSSPATVLVDLYAINELGLAGKRRLELVARGPDGRVLAEQAWPVQLKGGERYGQPLRRNERLQLDLAEGRVTLQSTLRPPDAAPDATRAAPPVVGRDELLLVDWQSLERPSGGRRVGRDQAAERFLSASKGVVLPPFDPSEPAPPWVLVLEPPPEPARALSVSEVPGGWRGTVFAAGRLMAERHDEVLDLKLPDDEPAPGVLAGQWELHLSGRFLPEQSGPYRFELKTSMGARLELAGRELLDEPDDRGPRALWSGSVELQAGEPVDMALTLFQQRDAAAVKLLVCPPSASAAAREQARALLRVAGQGGTRVLLVAGAAAWARLFHDQGALSLRGEFPIGRYWMGGGFLAGDHRLLAGLPSRCALGWEYQSLVSGERRRSGLLLGPQARTVIACWSDHQPRLGSSLAVVPVGRGELVLCSLDLPGALRVSPRQGVDVARRLLCNLITGGGGR